jgi:hypothetical protein
VEFTGNGDQTRVVLQHDRLPSASSRDRHRQGWDACLDNLERRIFPAAGRRDERHRTALKP